jgi:hypothetical protein
MASTSLRHVPVRPVKAVTVERDGRWQRGELSAWQRWPDGWHGFCLYGVAPGMRYLEWLPAERVREAAPASACPGPVGLVAGTGANPRPFVPLTCGFVVGDTGIEPVLLLKGASVSSENVSDDSSCPLVCLRAPEMTANPLPLPGTRHGAPQSTVFSTAKTNGGTPKRPLYLTQEVTARPCATVDLRSGSTAGPYVIVDADAWTLDHMRRSVTPYRISGSNGIDGSVGSHRAGAQPGGFWLLA